MWLFTWKDLLIVSASVAGHLPEDQWRKDLFQDEDLKKP